MSFDDRKKQLWYDRGTRHEKPWFRLPHLKMSVIFLRGDSHWRNPKIACCHLVELKHDLEK